MPQDKKMLNQLLLAKKMSDQENYVAKYNLMNKLLKDHPDEFYVDQDHPEYPGIVHAPTGFRMHLPRQATYGIEKKAKSEPTAEDLLKRPCCGSGCTNCPYSPKHKKGNTKVREELKKEAKIVKDKKSGKWILYTKDGSRILGKHENAQDAYKQEYAIEKSMQKKASFIVPNYFIKSSTAGAIEAPSQKAVIIKGSPRYIENNPKADKFYEELAKILSDSGYDTSYDAGEPYTIPDETASIWIGHSRGQDRLQYAPNSIKTLAIDQFEDRAKERREINRKLMEAAGAKSWAEWEDRPDPPDEHYQVTDDLRRAIRELIASKSEPVTKSSAINGTEEDVKASKSPIEGIKEDRISKKASNSNDGLSKVAQAKWRSIKNLLAVAKKTKSVSPEDLEYGTGLSQLKADVGAKLRLPGKDPISQRVQKSIDTAKQTKKDEFFASARGDDDRLRERFKKWNAIPENQNTHQKFLNKGEIVPPGGDTIGTRLYRGTVGGDPMAGGTYGGAFYYGSPFKEVARPYGKALTQNVNLSQFRTLNSGSNPDKLNIIHHYGAAPGQRYGGGWVPEDILSRNLVSQRNYMTNSRFNQARLNHPFSHAKSETAIIPGVNPYLGVELKASVRQAPLYFPAGPKANAAKHYLNNVQTQVRVDNTGKIISGLAQNKDMRTTSWIQELNAPLRKLYNNHPETFKAVMARRAQRYLAPGWMNE